MIVLTVERVPLSQSHTIWISEASILAMHADPASVVLAVDDTIHRPDSDYLRPPSEHFEDHRPRCADVIEATDEEIELLTGAGYRLTDLRNAGASDLLKAL